MFKFKLQDIQREEHYIPNWNFMPKTKKWWQVVFLVGTVWCLFRIIAGNCLNELFFFWIFYPLLDRDLLHKNEIKLITDWGGRGRGRGGGRTKGAGGGGGIRRQEKEKSGTQENSKRKGSESSEVTKKIKRNKVKKKDGVHSAKAKGSREEEDEEEEEEEVTKN